MKLLYFGENFIVLLRRELSCQLRFEVRNYVRYRGGDRSEAWDRETMFSQLAKRSSQNVDSGVRHNKYFRSTINLFEIVFRIYVYFVGGK